MYLQIKFLCVLFVTQTAYKSFVPLLIMGADMFLKVAFLSESPLANVAHKWFATCVCTEMIIQTPSLVKFSSTIIYEAVINFPGSMVDGLTF